MPTIKLNLELSTYFLLIRITVPVTFYFSIIFPVMVQSDLKNIYCRKIKYLHLFPSSQQVGKTLHLLCPKFYSLCRRRLLIIYSFHSALPLKKKKEIYLFSRVRELELQGERQEERDMPHLLVHSPDVWDGGITSLQHWPQNSF